MTVVGSDEAAEPTEPAEGHLGRQVRAGLGWSLINSFAGRLVTVLVGLVLARILEPREFGTFAVAFLVMAIVQSMNELGVSVAVVRWESDATRVARTATTVAIGMSVALYAAVLLLAPTIARAVHTPAAAGLLRVLGLGIVIDGVTSIPSAMMARAFMQRERAMADIAGSIPTALLSILLALSGHGAMSLVWGALAGNVVSAALILLLTPNRPWPGWHRDDAAELLRIGLPLAGTSLALLATLNVDYIVVGRTLGTVALGYYLLAFNLSSWPVNLLSVAVRRVAVAGFAKVRGEPLALAEAFRRSLAMLSAVAFLAAGLLSTLAAPLIHVAYGTTWQPSAAPLQMLAILGGMRILFDLGYDFLAAVASTRWLLTIQLVWFVGLVICLPIGARHGGIRGVAIAHCLVAGACIGPLYIVSIIRRGVSFGSIVIALTPPLVAAIVASVVVVVGRRAGWSALKDLLVLGPLATVLFVAIVAAAPEHRTFIRRARA